MHLPTVINFKDRHQYFYLLKKVQVGNDQERRSQKEIHTPKTEVLLGILRIKKITIGLDSLFNQCLIYLHSFELYIIVFVSTTLLKVAKLQQFSLATCCQSTGSLKRLK